MVTAIASISSRARRTRRALQLAASRRAVPGAASIASTRSSTPWPLWATVLTIGGRHAPSAAPRLSTERRSRTHLVGAVAVGLVDDVHVADLEDAGLCRLDAVAHARREQDHVVSASPATSTSRLAHADGLDQDDVAAGGVEHPQRLRSRPGQAAEVPAAWPSSGCRRRDRSRGPASGPGRRAARLRRTATTGRRRARRPACRLRRSAVTSAEVDVDLPTPGEPVMPMIWACPVCGASRSATSRSAGEASSTSEISRATARASPACARSTSSATLD